MIKFITNRSNYIIYLLFAVLVLIVGIPVSSKPEYVSHADSGVFLYIGQQILNGSIPYRDIWDHKGPVIYYIDALGLFIGQGSIWGVVFIEFLSVFSAVSLGYIVMSRAFGRIYAFFASILWLCGLFYVLENGNWTEVYALPLSFATLYLFSRFINSNLKLIYVFAIGIIFSISFLLRPNIIGMQLSVILFLSVYYIFTKRFYDYIKLISVFVLGFIVITIPVLLYFQWNNALTELIDQLFRYNSIYSKTTFRHHIGSLLFGMKRLWPSGLPIIASVAWIVGVFSIERNLKLKDSQQALTYLALIGLPVEVILSSISGRYYRSYYIPWLPILAILTCLFAFGITKNVSHSRFNLFKLNINASHIWIFAFLIAISSMPILTIFEEYMKIIYSDNQETIIYSDNRDLTSSLQIIRKHLEGETYLLIWGADPSFNVLTKMKSPTRYVYQYPLYTCGYTTEKMIEEFLNDITQKKPLIVDTSGSWLLSGDTTPIPPIDQNTRKRWKYGPWAGYKDESQACLLSPEMENVFKFISSHYKVVDTIKQNGWIIYKFIDNE